MLKNKDLDKKIILQLIRDARQPILQIAENVGATRQTIAKKIDQFCSSGLIRYFTPKLDAEKFGLSLQAYVLLNEEPQADLRRKNEEVIKGFPQVSEFHRIFGEYDGIIKVLVRDKKELTNLVKQIHELRGVRETETFIVHSTLKDKPEAPFMKVLRAPLNSEGEQVLW